MQKRGLPIWLKDLLNTRRPTSTYKEKGRRGADSEDSALKETRYLVKKLQSTPGLWECLCKATNEGKPKCLSHIIRIAHEAGLIETNTGGAKHTGAQSDSFTIYSEHHEATSRIGLPVEDSERLRIIVWALEGKTIKE